MGRYKTLSCINRLLRFFIFFRLLKLYNDLTNNKKMFLLENLKKNVCNIIFKHYKSYIYY